MLPRNVLRKNLRVRFVSEVTVLYMLPDENTKKLLFLVKLIALFEFSNYGDVEIRRKCNVFQKRNFNKQKHLLSHAIFTNYILQRNSSRNTSGALLFFCQCF